MRRAPSLAAPSFPLLSILLTRLQAQEADPLILLLLILAPEWQHWAEGASAPYGPFGPPGPYGDGGPQMDQPYGEEHRAPPSLAAAVQAMGAIQAMRRFDAPRAYTPWPIAACPRIEEVGSSGDL